MKYHYVYYSYEEYGRGYIGSRTCKCLPEEDLKYFGSFRDKTFKPTLKIILKSDYSTREEAFTDEIILHDFYDVANNSHFANKAKQTSIKFCLSEEQASVLGKRNGKIGSETNKKNKTSIFSLTTEELSEAGKKGGTKSAQVNKENKNCIFRLSKDQLSENGKKGGKRCKELGVGIHALTPEQILERTKKAQETHKKNGTGFYGLTKEERKEFGKKGSEKCKELGLGIFSLDSNQLSKNGSKGGRNTVSQRWMCTETGYITIPAALSRYQKARGIDTSKRIRLS